MEEIVMQPLKLHAQKHLFSALKVFALATSFLLSAMQGAQAAPFGYVPEAFDIAVIDTANNSLVTNILLPGFGSVGDSIAFTPDIKFGYASGVTTIDPFATPIVIQAQVWKIDATSNQIVGTPISLPNMNGVGDIVATPNGKLMYIAGIKITNFLPEFSQIFVISTTTDAIVKTIPLVTTLGGITSLIVSPDGARLYVSATAYENGVNVRGAVAIVDTASNTVIGPPIPLAPLSGVMAISPDGKRLYVASTNGSVLSDGLYVVDTATAQVVKTLRPAAGLGVYPTAMAFAPDGRTLWLGNDRDPMWLLDTTTEVFTQILQNGGRSIAFRPDGKFAYLIPITRIAPVVVVDTATLLATTAISIQNTEGTNATDDVSTHRVVGQFQSIQRQARQFVERLDGFSELPYPRAANRREYRRSHLLEHAVLRD
jgi:YVTN family beta-propeller protein